MATTTTNTDAVPKPASPSSQPSLSSAEATTTEKSNTNVAALDLERVGETQGYILDEAQLKEKLGLAPDAVLKKGKHDVVLIPQPSDDPEDPLNWSPTKKALILVVLAVVACTADYSAATGGSALLPQAQEWHISPDEVNHATAGYVHPFQHPAKLTNFLATPLCSEWAD